MRVTCTNKNFKHSNGSMKTFGGGANSNVFSPETSQEFSLLKKMFQNMTVINQSYPQVRNQCE